MQGLQLRCFKEPKKGKSPYHPQTCKSQSRALSNRTFTLLLTSSTPAILWVVLGRFPTQRMVPETWFPLSKGICTREFTSREGCPLSHSSPFWLLSRVNSFWNPGHPTGSNTANTQQGQERGIASQPSLRIIASRQL